MRKLLPVVLAAMAGLVFGVTPAGAASNQFVYSSLPATGTIQSPSEGAESASFNHIGNEVILTKPTKVVDVSVTVTNWACQTGNWFSGDCKTNKGAKMPPTPMTLTIYKASKTNPATGEVTPGAKIISVTKTFKQLNYRPSTSASCPLENGVETEFMGSDGKCYHGHDQNIVFDLTSKPKLPVDVVWSVSYNTDNSGPNPIGGSGAPTDSLNIALTPKATKGLNRTDDSIFWDTRVQSQTCASPTDGNSGPFVTGEVNRDGPCDGTTNSWAGLVPAAKFIVPA